MSVASSADFIRALVETKPPGHPSNIVEIIGAKLDCLSKSIQNSAKLSREAMTDLLKFTFNLLLHYPKVRSTDANYYGLLTCSLDCKRFGRDHDSVGG